MAHSSISDLGRIKKKKKYNTRVHKNYEFSLYLKAQAVTGKICVIVNKPLASFVNLSKVHVRMKPAERKLMFNYI